MGEAALRERISGHSVLQKTQRQYKHKTKPTRKKRDGNRQLSRASVQRLKRERSSKQSAKCTTLQPLCLLNESKRKENEVE